MLVPPGTSWPRIREAMVLVDELSQSRGSTVHSTSLRPRPASTFSTRASVSPYGGRASGVVTTPARCSARWVRRSVWRTWWSVRVVSCSCAQVWFPTRKPDRATSRAVEGDAATR